MQVADECPELVLVEESDELVDLLAVLDGDDGGDGLDAEVEGEVAQLVDVHDGQVDLALSRGDCCVQSEVE